MKNLHVHILAVLLLLVSAGVVAYKVIELKLPLKPVQQSEVWLVEAKVVYKAVGGPAKIGLILPIKGERHAVLDENFVSGRYGLTVEDVQGQRIAQWALRRPKGEQTVYYRLQVTPEASKSKDVKSKPFSEPQNYPESWGTAITALLDEVRSKSADIKTFTHELLIRLNQTEVNDNIKLLKENIRTQQDWVQRIMLILKGARIACRQVNLLMLNDGMRHGQLTPWLEVYNGQRWLAFNPDTGTSGYPANALIWYYGNQPLLNVDGGRRGQVDFSVHRQSHGMTQLAQLRAEKNHEAVMAFSLFSLPVQTQNVYRILIMVPMGALLIVMLRNLVGFKTFGTFMPILIGMAFRETELLWGVFLFSVLVGFGLLIRFYLEYLRLLLVPRLAAVLIIVIILMTLLSLLTHKLGIDRGLSVALFPMVILAMTIERMSLVWEEHGPKEALQQYIGSMLVASLSFLLMTNLYLEHLLFVFPELMLALLALTLWLGRYTGYRLTELWRFRVLLRH
ncbi:MAG: inactive transglutaminase family protein [Methylococcales bacterium]|nr:inactive transglutaminase family protein [Methylococcales bacterium]